MISKIIGFGIYAKLFIFVFAIWRFFFFFNIIQKIIEKSQEFGDKMNEKEGDLMNVIAIGNWKPKRNM